MCFGELVTCTLEACVVECATGFEESQECRDCVFNSCEQPTGVFDFPECSGTPRVEPADLSACTRPYVSLIDGISDPLFFSLVGVGGIILIVGGYYGGKYLWQDDEVDSIADAEDKRMNTYVSPGSSYPAGAFANSPPPMSAGSSTPRDSLFSAPKLFGSKTQLTPPPQQIIINGEVFTEEPFEPLGALGEQPQSPRQRKNTDDMDIDDF